MLKIDVDRCDGCSTLDRPRCVDICPGDVLFLNQDGKTAGYDLSECWDCLACVKECPRRALSTTLSFQINESRSSLRAHHAGANTVFELRDSTDRRTRRFVVPSLNLARKEPPDG